MVFCTGKVNFCGPMVLATRENSVRMRSRVQAVMTGLTTAIMKDRLLMVSDRGEVLTLILKKVWSMRVNGLLD